MAWHSFMLVAAAVCLSRDASGDAAAVIPSKEEELFQVARLSQEVRDDLIIWYSHWKMVVGAQVTFHLKGPPPHDELAHRRM
jgi:hypothetical protein